MCLIVAKPHGVRMPSNNNLARWFKSHPDGFGLAYLDEGKVRIIKGAMDIKGVKRIVKTMRKGLGKTSPKDIDVIFHFRQATNGVISMSNCHPFPVSSDQAELASLDTNCEIAIAHNGIIWGVGDKYNYNNPIGFKTDTQEFIEDYITQLRDALWNKAVQGLIEAATSSKFVLLSNRGLTYIGKFVEDGGLFYSNQGYKLYYGKPITFTPSVNHNAKKYQPPYEEAADYDSPTSLVQCDFCQQYTSIVYGLPEDKLSGVCHGCFVVLTNRYPTMYDIRY